MRGLRLVLPREPRKPQATKVGKVFAEREFAVEVNAGDRLNGVVLLDHALRAFIEFLLVFFRPPILEIAVFIELAALVVEAMREFVADGRAHVAIIGGIIFLVAEEGRLKVSGGKVDVILLRIVVGVDGRAATCTTHSCRPACRFWPVAG